MIHVAYPATFSPASRWEPAETGVAVAFRNLPEAHTRGEDEADAARMAEDCLRVALEARMRHGEDLPPPSAPLPGERMVEPGAALAAKAGLYGAVREAGVPNRELARRLGVDEKEVRRMLDPGHPTKLPRLDAALRALGRRLVVEVRDAAAAA